MDNLDLQLSNLLISRFNTKSSDHIPIDLIIDIFSRFPAKSIARFRCLSKIWGSILRGPDFTDLFLKRSFSRPRILFNFKIDDTLLFFSSPQPQNLGENSSLVTIADHSTHFTTNGASGICKPVNGLVCSQISGNEDTVTEIYNPSTGESLTLPKLGTNTIDARNCLGYDPINKQFKVFCTILSRYGTCNVSEEYHVLTLGIGTLLWRKIECVRSHYPLYNGICINGVLYYPAAVNSSSKVSMIVCFDVKSEKFSFLDIPQGFVFGSYSSLINYKGKLGAFHCKRVIGFGQRSDLSTRFYKLWVLRDAEEQIWLKKIYEIPFKWRVVLEETDLYLAGITNRGEFVLSPFFVLCDPFYVFFYTLGEESFVKVEIKGLEGFKNHKVYTFINFVEDVKCTGEFLLLVF